jgi:hypothetical protein
MGDILQRTLALCHEREEGVLTAIFLRLMWEVITHTKTTQVDAAGFYYCSVLKLTKEFGMQPSKANCHFCFEIFVNQIVTNHRSGNIWTTPSNCSRPWKSTLF